MGKLDKTQWVDTMIFLNKDSHMQHRQFDKGILAKYPKTASANSTNGLIVGLISVA